MDVPVSSASAIVSNAVSVMGSKQLIRILGVSGNSVVTVLMQRDNYCTRERKGLFIFH